MNILITGATGFVGNYMGQYFSEKGMNIVKVSRRKLKGHHLIEDYSNENSWQEVLKGIDVVVHLAAIVHQINEGPEHAEEYYQFNRDNTLLIAREAKRQGVKKFIFLSSVKVMGESKDRPYYDEDEACPIGPYADSKRQAEKGLMELASDGFDIFSLRPPLVYGPNVKANFKAMEKMVDLGFPLPLRGLVGKRSLIFVGNLVDAALTCVNSNLKGYHEFLISDAKPLSVPEIVKLIAKAKNKKIFLFKIPNFFFKFLLMLMGKKDAYGKLNENLIVDCGKIKRELDWKPPYTTESALQTYL